MGDVDVRIVEAAGKPVSAAVPEDGAFTVTNARNGFSKTYNPK
jgi:hypothetical protein